MASLIERKHDAWLVDPADVVLTEDLRERTPDVCWLSLHGKEGEDGTAQRLLDLLGLAYTGTAAFDCELAFDKVLAKDALRRAEVATPDWAVVEGWALRDLGAGSAMDAVVAKTGLPCIVKPSRSGSALGVTTVEREDGLPAAVMSALSFSGAVLVERKVEGTEVAVSLIGTGLEPLPVVEIVPKDGVYDYAARYTAGATEYFTPSRLSDDVTLQVVEMAQAAATAMSLRDMTRVDLMVDRDGAPWVLEVNVSPGMTETSLLPMAAHSAGMSLADVCERVLRSVVERSGH